jgi:hypothetical protein
MTSPLVDCKSNTRTGIYPHKLIFVVVTLSENDIRIIQLRHDCTDWANMQWWHVISVACDRQRARQGGQLAALL